MKIAKAEAIPLAIPFSSGPFSSDGKPAGWGGQAWTTLDMVLIRVETESGLVGWGEAFGFATTPVTIPAIRDVVAPLAVGQDAGDIDGLTTAIKRRLQNMMHAGPARFAAGGTPGGLRGATPSRGPGAK